MTNAALNLSMDSFSTPNGLVEAILAEPAETAGRFSVLYVHGYGFDAIASLPIAWYLAGAGARTLLISQPGFGSSDGPPDYCGPKTVAAAIEAGERLARRAGGRPVGIWGFSRGAIVTGQVIRARPDLFGAAVVQSGGYDLQRDFEMSGDEGFRRNVMLETGGDVDALRERSLIHHVTEVRRPLLILQGDSDTTYRPENALRLVDALAREGKPHEYAVLPGEHELPWADVAKIAIPFLERRLA